MILLSCIVELVGKCLKLSRKGNRNAMPVILKTT